MFSEWIKNNRTTVARYRRAFQTMPQVPTGSIHYLDLNIPFVPSVNSLLSPPPVPPRNALLLPHVIAITSKLQEGFSAQRIYQDLIEDSTYHGSYDSIKRYACKLKKKVPHFYERLSVFPSREGQVDFSFGPLIGSGRHKKRSWLFKMTLSFSRHAYEELVYSQNVETFLRCHERAFAFFGGVPETILNSVYLAFSNWYAFIICPVNLKAEEVMYLQKAKAIGHQMSKLIYQMLVQKDPGVLKKVRGILFLRKSFKPEILEAAAGQALTRLSHSYLFVKAICESLVQKKDHTEKDSLTNRHECFTHGRAEEVCTKPHSAVARNGG